MDLDDSTKEYILTVNTYVCNYCYKSFTIKETLEKHIIQHIEELKRSEERLIEHNNNAKEVYVCIYCDDQFIAINDYQCHIQSHVELESTEKNTSNDNYDDRASDKKPYNQELDEENVSEEKPHVCELCDKIFTKHKAYTRHIKSHIKGMKFVYKSPDKEVTENNNLNRKTAKQKSFQCDYCNLVLSNRGNLRRHIKTRHTYEVYTCEQCNKKFQYHSTLQNHKCTQKKQNHKCTKCQKTFLSRDKLVIHKKTHTKPYVCSICDKKFGSFGNLQTHSRIHTGERPYGCEYCSKKFSDFSAYYQHKKQHTGAEPYACKACGKKFKYSNGLKRHILTHSA